jgi:ferredoxin
MTTDGKNVTVVWRRRDGSTVSTTAAAGTSLLRVAHQYGIELEGACEGVCACSTCHVILPENVYKTLPDASEDEEDMLDQAFGLTPTSRLGCQVVLDPSLEGMTIVVPKATRNMAVDGYVAKPH